MQVMFDVEEVQRISGILKQAPEHRRVRVGRSEAIQMLAPDIATLQSKGYSIAEIAGMLAELGLKVSALGLKEYLRDARGGRSRKKKRPPRASAGGPAGGAVARELGGPAGPSRASKGRREVERAPAKRGEEAGAQPVTPAPGGDATFSARRPIGVGAPGSGTAPTPAGPKGTFVPREDTPDL